MFSKRLASVVVALSAICSVTSKPISVGDPSINHLTVVNSATDFCLFLPPKPGMVIGEHEHDAVVFCLKPNAKAPKAQMFPKGFIKSAHAKKTSSYVQVTGQMNPSAYKLSRKDGGGQFDNRGAPPKSGCNGYTYFVSLIEPDNGNYCIRCCNEKNDCNMGLSTEGCETVIPGDYS
ncbi:hypothetical protein K493DRAFT_313426 [Basidiobolus meristosporus CBS 931.73]|uniref:Uncharacterized protein n=1 Tax=Basidiobolus meristosporus CBS 931.73 TaxID=1314790 RepID=A0A1Y1YMQ1_9FUNG|nr:hypothetical protein K493DRAFT_313426 [Basidiobolus meristosporus CBS 931.73]|eukprot:ORX99016.1 hypothetical protein K493DRAFT_313426 [Basidiobolus meristosporus CBS 931.73]